jgi:hypothetical protein
MRISSKDHDYTVAAPFLGTLSAPHGEKGPIVRWPIRTLNPRDPYPAVLTRATIKRTVTSNILIIGNCNHTISMPLTFSPDSHQGTDDLAVG